MDRNPQSGVDADLVSALLAEMRALRAKVEALETRALLGDAAAVNVATAGAMLGCGRTRVFDLLRRGLLKSAPVVGRAKMIAVASIRALLLEGIPTGRRGGRAVRKAASIKPADLTALAPRTDLGAALLRLPV